MNNSLLETRVYFVKNPNPNPALDTVDGSDRFIAIEHGETKYSKTTVYNQEHANVLNERQQITPAQALAAYECSLFNTWENFDKVTKREEELAK